MLVMASDPELARHSVEGNEINAFHFSKITSSEISQGGRTEKEQ
jgi:hypothetical protein